MKPIFTMGENVLNERLGFFFFFVFFFLGGRGGEREEEVLR